MFRLSNLGRVAALGAFGSLVALAACNSEHDVVAPIPRPTAVNPIFQSYVAIGNSITAGFQSNGMNDSTQRQAYPRLLAGVMNTYYRYPSLAMPGCPAPIANTRTGALVTTGTPAGTTPATCSGRTFNTDTSEILTNVAVPGARVLDPTATSTAASNVFTNVILRGKTQVQQALRAKPTFASVWIGNNNVLVAGLSGILVARPALGQAGIIGTQAEFQTNYDLMMTQLLAGAPGLKGILIGVAKVQYLPSLSSGGLIASSATIQGGLNQATGTTVTVMPNCTASTSLINVPSLIVAIRRYVANNADPLAHPPVISCDQTTSAPYPYPIGDIYVLDANEQTTLNNTIDGYNNYISGKATALGFAYYDPNTLFAARRTSGEIPPFPNLASSNATFGALISLDGVHPSGAAHLLLANDLITAINAKYGTTLTAAQ
jgi:lysophospholipase L1-like esterase